MKLNAIITLSAAMCVALTVSAGAHAQSLSDEVRCVLVSNAVAAGSNNPRGRQIGASVGAYFMGRLDARQPAQVKAAMVQQKQRRMAGSEAATLMNACTARAGRAEAQLRSLAK